MKPIIKAFLEAWQKRQALIAQKESTDAKTDVVVDRIQIRYNDRMDKLRHASSKITSAFKRRRDAEVAVLDRQIATEAESIAKVERIRAILQLNQHLVTEPGSPEWDDTTVKPYRDRFIEHLGDFYRDDYMLIRLYIYETDKPKNKFTLAAIGKNRLVEFPYNHPVWTLDFSWYYGLDLNTYGNGFSITVSIKNAPTVEELKVYLEKHRDTLLAPLIAQHQTLLKELQEVRENYTEADFVILDTVPEITSTDAPLVCLINGNEMRLFNGYFWIQTQDPEKDTSALEYIRVANNLFRQSAPKGKLMITQCSNMVFGNWYSVDIESYHDGKGNIPFTKETWERVLREVEAIIATVRDPSRISYSPPQVQWVNPELCK